MTTMSTSVCREFLGGHSRPIQPQHSEMCDRDSRWKHVCQTFLESFVHIAPQGKLMAGSNWRVIQQRFLLRHDGEPNKSRFSAEQQRRQYSSFVQLRVFERRKWSVLIRVGEIVLYSRLLTASNVPSADDIDLVSPIILLE